jgi:hypothetical protein
LAATATAHAEEATDSLRRVAAAEAGVKAAAQFQLLQQPELDPATVAGVLPRLIEEPGAWQVAVWWLGEVGDTACRWLPRAQDQMPPDAASQLAAAISLARCGELGSLRQRLASRDPVVRAKAAVTLGLLGDRDSLAEVRRAEGLPDSAHGLFFGLARCLLGDASAAELVPALRRVPAMRVFSELASARLGGSWSADAVVAAVRPGGDTLLAEAAARLVLAECGPRSGDVLALLASSPSPRLRRLGVTPCSAAPR